MRAVHGGSLDLSKWAREPILCGRSRQAAPRSDRTALKARDMLQAEGVPTAVVSMPCWELFELQDKAYRDMVIDRGIVRVAVEAAVRQGWERYIGEDGGFVGMDGFGASGSVPDLYDHYGITPRRVADEVKARI